MSLTEELIQAINNTKVAEVVRVSADTETRIHLVHRVKPRMLRVWLGVLTYILSRKQGWDEHISKQYFLRNGKMVYGWNFIAQWESAEQRNEILTQLRNLIRRATQELPRTGTQLEAYPIMAKPGRNEPGGAMNFKASGYRQRGAHRIGGK